MTPKGMPPVHVRHALEGYGCVSGYGSIVGSYPYLPTASGGVEATRINIYIYIHIYLNIGYTKIARTELGAARDDGLAPAGERLDEGVAVEEAGHPVAWGWFLGFVLVGVCLISLGLAWGLAWWGVHSYMHTHTTRC